MSEATSNYRKLKSLIDTVERLYNEKILINCELFLFTDNLVVDCVYDKGYSTSKTLFLLILRLRKLQMKSDLILHVMHISGKRMIESGVDSLSRGDT